MVWSWPRGGYCKEKKFIKVFVTVITLMVSIEKYICLATKIGNISSSYLISQKYINWTLLNEGISIRWCATNW